jgi:hypothetical protein
MDATGAGRPRAAPPLAPPALSARLCRDAMGSGGRAHRTPAPPGSRASRQGDCSQPRPSRSSSQVVSSSTSQSRHPRAARRPAEGAPLVAARQIAIACAGFPDARRCALHRRVPTRWGGRSQRHRRFGGRDGRGTTPRPPSEALSDRGRRYAEPASLGHGPHGPAERSSAGARRRHRRAVAPPDPNLRRVARLAIEHGDRYGLLGADDRNAAGTFALRVETDAEMSGEPCGRPGSAASRLPRAIRRTRPRRGRPRDPPATGSRGATRRLS